jgi:hypothetical protein
MGLIDALMPLIEVVIDLAGDLLATLMPALVELINALLPLIEAVVMLAGDLLSALIPAMVASANAILPIINLILPVFTNLLAGIVDIITKFLVPAISTVVNWLASKLTPAFEGISRAISSVIGWVQGLIDKLKAIKLPDWLTPGSPTPFETGLRGIADAMRDVDSEIGGITVAPTAIANGISPMAGAGGKGRMVNVTLEMHSVVSLSDMADAERKLNPIVSRIVREAMAA